MRRELLRPHLSLEFHPLVTSLSEVVKVLDASGQVLRFGVNFWGQHVGLSLLLANLVSSALQRKLAHPDEALVSLTNRLHVFCQVVGERIDMRCASVRQLVGRFLMLGLQSDERLLALTISLRPGNHSFTDIFDGRLRHLANMQWKRHNFNGAPVATSVAEGVLAHEDTAASALLATTLHIF